MPGITLEQAQAQLDAWMEASLAVSQNQSYSIAGRDLTRADAGKIREMIEFWDTKCQQLGRGNSTMARYATPVA